MSQSPEQPHIPGIWGAVPQPSSPNFANSPQGPSGPEGPDRWYEGPSRRLPEPTIHPEAPSRAPDPDDISFGHSPTPSATSFGDPRMAEVPASSPDGDTAEAKERTPDETKAEKDPLFRIGKFRKLVALGGVAVALGAGGFGVALEGAANNEFAAYDRAYQDEHKFRPDSKEYNRAQTIADDHAQKGASDKEMASAMLEASGLGALVAAGVVLTTGIGGVRRGVVRLVSSEKRAERLRNKAAQLEAKQGE